MGSKYWDESEYSDLEESATASIDGQGDFAGAAEMQAAHTRQVAKLREAGVLVVETLPEHLTADVINQYLEVKARQMM